MITPEELELLDEHTKQRILQELQQSEQLKQELQAFLSKAYSNPEAKRKLQDALQTIDGSLTLPNNPAENYIEPIKKELEDLKRDQAIQSLSQRLKAKAQALGITQEEAPAIEKFMADKGILTYESAMELYAMQRNQDRMINTSVTQGDMLSDILDNKAEFDIKKAKQKAFENLQSMIYGR